MPTYIYKARDATGKRVSGTMDGKTKEELIDKLHRMGYMTTQVVEALPSLKIERVFERLEGISTEDKILFYVQLSNMIKAGINILASLQAINNQIENKRLKEIIGNVLRNIEAGNSFSEALAKHPRIFPKLFVSMVKAGEASGKLSDVLDKYAVFYEHQAQLRQKIKGALFYPAILLFAGILVILFIVTFIIPQFSLVFLKAGIKLPLVTQILYRIGIGIKQFWYLGVLMMVICWLGIRYYANTERGRFKLDRFKLKLPVYGQIYRKAAISRFARTLGTLVASGVPILQSLDITRDVVGNEVLGRVIDNVYSSVERGERISESLKISEEFPQDTVQMISAGEETGNLDGMLNKIADFYNMSIGYAIEKLTTILEPLFLVIMGSMVGFIMASMLLPMFDMIKILRR